MDLKKSQVKKKTTSKEYIYIYKMMLLIYIF